MIWPYYICMFKRHTSASRHAINANALERGTRMRATWKMLILLHARNTCFVMPIYIRRCTHKRVNYTQPPKHIVSLALTRSTYKCMNVYTRASGTLAWPRRVCSVRCARTCIARTAREGNPFTRVRPVLRVAAAAAAEAEAVQINHPATRIWFK